MTEKLRRSFVRITMLSLTGMLVLLMVMVNLLNFLAKDRDFSSVLKILVENGGSFPSSEKLKEEENDSITLETPFETRYFTVLMSLDGSFSEADTGNIAAVSAKKAKSMARKLYDAGKQSGYSGVYKYCTIHAGDYIGYVFLDCTRSLLAVRDFLINSFILSSAFLFLMYLCICRISTSVVRPVVESRRKQQEFITAAGHELRTPLSVISSCAEVIEMENGESKWTKGIRDQVGRLKELTDDLIVLSKMDEGRAGNFTRVNLSSVLTDAAEVLKLTESAKGYTVSEKIADGLTIWGDEKLLRRLCSVLLDNAGKYADDGSCIEVCLGKSGGAIDLSCRNRAENLTPGDQQKLFERFYRGDSSRSSGISGYGLGLSIAKSIAEIHRAEIRAEYADGKVLEIKVRFP